MSAFHPWRVFSSRTIAPVLLVVMALWHTALAAEITPFEADYRATFMGLQASAKMSLTRAEGEQAEGEGAARWMYRLEIEGAGARLMQATLFEADGDDWRPLSSHDSQRGESGVALLLVKNRSTTSSWDWQLGEARWSGDIAPERSAPVPLQPGDLDAMLLNLVLVRQRFQRAGTEEISVGGQTHRALKVRREDGNRSITAWVVEGVPVPVRILQQRKGKDHIDLRLSQWPALP